jgi:chromosomal replication initiator protein
MNKEKQILNTVLYMVCTYYGVEPDDVKGKDRARHLVIARQIYCNLARTYTRSTLKQIGSIINRDHATVIYGNRQTKILSTIEKKTAYDLRSIVQLNPEIKELFQIGNAAIHSFK